MGGNVKIDDALLCARAAEIRAAKESREITLQILLLTLKQALFLLTKRVKMAR